MNHDKEIIVNCWKCHKEFDIVKAGRCYQCLNTLSQMMGIDTTPLRWTTKCFHCGACICHKIQKMQSIECDVLNKVGIMNVMPSVKRSLQKIRNEMESKT